MSDVSLSSYGNEQFQRLQQKVKLHKENISLFKDKFRLVQGEGNKVSLQIENKDIELHGTIHTTQGGVEIVQISLNIPRNCKETDADFENGIIKIYRTFPNVEYVNTPAPTPDQFSILFYKTMRHYISDIVNEELSYAELDEINNTIFPNMLVQNNIRLCLYGNTANKTLVDKDTLITLLNNGFEIAQIFKEYKERYKPVSDLKSVDVQGYKNSFSSMAQAIKFMNDELLYKVKHTLGVYYQQKQNEKRELFKSFVIRILQSKNLDNEIRKFKQIPFLIEEVYAPFVYNKVDIKAYEINKEYYGVLAVLGAIYDSFVSEIPIIQDYTQSHIVRYYADDNLNDLSIKQIQSVIEGAYRVLKYYKENKNERHKDTLEQDVQYAIKKMRTAPFLKYIVNI